jgi:branched-chain amino acid transport system permease protein
VRLLSIRSNERAAQSVGIGIVETKALVFAFSSVLAATAGVLMTYSVGQFSSGSFDVLSVGLPLLAFAYLGGITSLYGALVGALSVPGGVVYVLVSGWFQNPGSWYLLFSGFVLILTAILNPEGIAGATAKLFSGRRSLSRRRPGPEGSVEPTSMSDGVEVKRG